MEHIAFLESPTHTSHSKICLVHQKGCKLKIYQHRCNTTSQLRSTAFELGLEIDVRSNQKDLYLAHDPFQGGEKLSDWLKGYQHSGLIVNVKEEGLENRVLELMEEKGITDFFFLDQSFPSLVKFGSTGDSRAAIRASDLEGFYAAKSSPGLFSWTWLDDFGTVDTYELIGKASELKGMKICLVSPELHGRDTNCLLSLQQGLLDLGWLPDGVCTKTPNVWQIFRKTMSLRRNP